MGRYTGKQIVKQLLKNGIKIPGASALILGATFKENVSDIRNSKVFDIANELSEFGITVTISDPKANVEEVKKEYAFELSANPIDTAKPNTFDAIILAVSHNEYLDYSEETIQKHLSPNGIFADVKGAYRNRFKNLNYWSL